MGLKVLSIFALVLAEALALPAKVVDSRKLCKFHRAISIKCQQSERPCNQVYGFVRFTAQSTPKRLSKVRNFTTREPNLPAPSRAEPSRLPTFIRLACRGARAAKWIPSHFHSGELAKRDGRDESTFISKERECD